jgi:hypothetical protein
VRALPWLLENRLSAKAIVSEGSLTVAECVEYMEAYHAEKVGPLVAALPGMINKLNMQISALRNGGGVGYVIVELKEAVAALAAVRAEQAQPKPFMGEDPEEPRYDRECLDSQSE